VVLAFVHAVSRGWSRARLPLGLLLVVAGLVLAGSQGMTSLPRWLGAGLAMGVVLLIAYAVVLRHHLALVPAAAAGLVMLEVVREGGIGAYPGALVGSIVAVLLIVVAAWFWLGRMTADTADTTDGGEPPQRQGEGTEQVEVV
jgi:hypothetical protein